MGLLQLSEECVWYEFPKAFDSKNKVTHTHTHTHTVFCSFETDSYYVTHAGTDYLLGAGVIDMFHHVHWTCVLCLNPKSHMHTQFKILF